MKSQILVTLSMSLLLSGVSGNAQVNKRRGNQQDRIAQGVQSGELSTGETRNLESREANLNREIRTDKTANGGKLTADEKAQVNRQQNRLSNNIRNDKTNSNVAHYGTGEIGKRRENQQDRIAQGIQNGSLKAGETAKLEGREQHINQQIRADRQADGGGKLTGAQRAQINRSQNRASRAVYRNKHN